jgi:2-dehydro-3-deoxyphosphogluconate aldolase/(4S)-4-hydroxy-2-oxoglutarate aldolase
MGITKLKALGKIVDSGLVAVVRAENSDQAAGITEACAGGGVAAVEITFTVPGAAKLISELSTRCTHEQILIGAGTVLDPETACTAILCGAQFVVSPSLNPETARLSIAIRFPTYLERTGSKR